MAEQDVAMQVLQQVVKLPVVRVERSKFLVDKFSKELDPKDITTLLEQGPSSLLSQETLDRVANACIMDNVLLASGTSVLAGLPGGLTGYGNYHTSGCSTVLCFFIEISSRIGIYLRL